MIDVKAFNGMSAMDIEKELTAMYNEPGGLDKIAALALQPIQEDVLYESRARQIFAQYDLAPGEEAVFDGDVRVPGYALSVEGLPYQVEVKSNRVRIDTSPLSAKALVRWNESNYRKFDMLDWTQARAKSSLLEQEDAKAIAVLNAASTAYHSAISCTTKLTIEAIAQAKATVSDALRTQAVKLIIPTIREKDLIILSTSGNTPIYAPTKQDELIRKGVIGDIVGLEVISIPKRQDGTNIIDPNTAYVIGPKELVGVTAVRTEIVPKTQVSVKDEGDIIAYWEDIGFYCRYAKGITKISIS
jgi:hypothetical protein